MRRNSIPAVEPRASQPKPRADSYWESEAKRILKAELARQGMSYKALVIRLEALGVKDEEGAIRNRISRGKFPLVFFLQCMRAIGVTEVDLRERAG
jgi:hypothetical protein